MDHKHDAIPAKAGIQMNETGPRLSPGLRSLFKTHPWLSYVLACDIILMTFLVDQINKWVMLEWVIRPATFENPPDGMGFFDWITMLDLLRYPFTQIEIWPFHNIVMVWNQGISFGLLGDHPVAANGLLMGLLGLVVVGFIAWIICTPRHGLRLILALIIGGALGNLWDRVRFGAVADFYDFHLFGVHYPAFNIADAAIVLGVLGLILYEWMQSKQKSSR
jgi:signal peptidase II